MRVLSPRDAFATKKMALSWRGESKYPCNIIVKTQRGNNSSEGDSRKKLKISSLYEKDGGFFVTAIIEQRPDNIIWT